MRGEQDPDADATRTVDEAPSKPHPGMLLGLMDELGTLAGETLMIGDTQWDLQMAQNAGTHGLGVLSGSHSREDLELCAPIACLPSVREVPTVGRETFGYASHMAGENAVGDSVGAVPGRLV